jgi:hypothetical protein
VRFAVNKVELGQVSLLVIHFSFSLVSTSPPAFYIHLYLSVALIRRRNGPILEAFQKVTLFRKLGVGVGLGGNRFHYVLKGLLIDANIR